jgi:hypothetical protein
MNAEQNEKVTVNELVNKRAADIEQKIRQRLIDRGCPRIEPSRFDVEFEKWALKMKDRLPRVICEERSASTLEQEVASLKEEAAAKSGQDAESPAEKSRGV